MTTIPHERAPRGAGHGVRLHVQVTLLVDEHAYVLGEADLACDLGSVYAWLARTPRPSLPDALRERLATLCQRLGVTEPAYDQLGVPEATVLLARLQAEEADLLQTVEQAQAAPPETQEAPPVEKALIRQLKQRWRARFHPPGSVEDVFRAWECFKQRVCGEVVSDRAMHAGQYELPLGALEEPAAEKNERR